jgi:hypothetical protein
MWITSFDEQKLCNFRAEKIQIFKIKNRTLFILSHLEGLLICRRKLPPSKQNRQHLKPLNFLPFSTFVLLLSGIRIRIQPTKSMRIHADPDTTLVETAPPPQPIEPELLPLFPLYFSLSVKQAEVLSILVTGGLEVGFDPVQTEAKRVVLLLILYRFR